MHVYMHARTRSRFLSNLLPQKQRAAQGGSGRRKRAISVASVRKGRHRLPSAGFNPHTPPVPPPPSPAELSAVDGRERSNFSLTTSAEWEEEETVWAGPPGRRNQKSGGKMDQEKLHLLWLYTKSNYGEQKQAAPQGRAAGRESQSPQQIPSGQRGVRAAAGGVALDVRGQEGPLFSRRLHLFLKTVIGNFICSTGLRSHSLG